jgi:FG-GAP-like repeat/Abnormal spindle-like microcephaly-assoc'd, ASPM-SPD-2-Hydin
MRLVSKLLLLRIVPPSPYLGTQLGDGIHRLGWLVFMGLALFVTACPFGSAQAYFFGAEALTIPSGPSAIALGDFNGDGRTDLAVADGVGISILLGTPQGSFAGAVNYSTGVPTGLAVGDVNGDGKLDLIVVTGPVEIMLGNGDGTFQTPFTIPNISGTAVAVGDFNHDGKLDLAIATGSTGPAVCILLGNGNGTFGTGVDYPTIGSFSVIVSDFNGDGNLDLAVGHGYSGGGGDEISILLGRGDGTFKPYISVPAPGDGDDSLAAADLNDDGKLDLVVASFYNSAGGVSVLLGNGDGTFAPAVSYPAPSDGTNSVAIGDFNGDGHPDIAATNYPGYDLSVFLGVGNGTFKSAMQYPASIDPVGLVIGDFNGDGLLDIASIAGYGSSAAITVLIGRGNGTFASHVNHTIPLYPFNVAAGDFNGDGIPDLAVDSFKAPGSVSILLGKGNGNFTIHTDIKVGNYPSFLATGDFNGDGNLDVVVGATDPKSGTEVLSTLLGKGNGTFEAQLSQTLTSDPGNFAVADFNLDGKLDLATCQQLTTGVSVFLGNGDGTFSAPLFFDAGNNADFAGGPAFAADLNGDGKPDLAVSTSNGISVLLGDGNGSFQRYKAILPGYSLLAVGDFNGDGNPDLAVTNGTLSIGIALGNGRGTFDPPKITAYVPAVLSLTPLIAGDFNGDGKLDVAFLSASAQTLSILPGNGDGTFGQRIDLPAENSPWSLAAADFTGSGGLDIAVGVGVLGDQGAVSLYSNRPVGALYPSSLQFGSQTVGTTSPALNTTFYNPGATPMALSEITTTNGYAQTNNCGETLAVGSSCTISVSFKPTKAGTQKGHLSVKDNATSNAQEIELNGVGVK